jgi:putative zinc finger protein
MKCDDFLNLLEAYVDGEVDERVSEQVRTHLMTCANCENEFEALTAESELYARYDRELQISPAAWNGIAARIAPETSVIESPARKDVRGWFAGLFAIPRFGFAFSGALAALLAMFVVGYLFLRTQPEKTLHVAGGVSVRVGSSQIPVTVEGPTTSVKDPVSAQNPRPVDQIATGQKRLRAIPDDPGVLFTDTAYSDVADKDTASHLDQAQKLLVSFRGLPSDDDQDVDVSYEKSESRRLLNENVVLRRDAEAAGKFPTKSVLGSLEPFLIDIANLPDKAPANDVRQIKDRVQRTEIVAELRSY